jgi:hypothetical protein
LASAAAPVVRSLIDEIARRLLRGTEVGIRGNYGDDYGAFAKDTKGERAGIALIPHAAA